MHSPNSRRSPARWPADFALSVLAPAARAADEAAELRPSIMSSVWQLGLAQAVADTEACASQQPTVQNALLLEEPARGDAAAALAIAAPLGFAKAIAEQGSGRQRRELPLFLRNQPHYSAIGHVDAGLFNGAGRPTRAIKTEAGYRILGTKGLVPIAAKCDHLLVLATCDGADEALIVPMREDGVVGVSAARETLGLRACAMADIALDNVFVPAHMRLGENAGANVQRIIDSSRVALSAILTGLSRAVFDIALPYRKSAWSMARRSPGSKALPSNWPTCRWRSARCDGWD